MLLLTSQTVLSTSVISTAPKSVVSEVRPPLGRREGQTFPSLCLSVRKLRNIFSYLTLRC